MDDKIPAHIHLFGDPEENFYALGARDKDSFQEIYLQITRLCARADFLAKALKISAELAGNLQGRGEIDLNKELKAYAQGLERPVGDVRFLLLLPEIVASFNKWIPKLMNVIPGCSSLFSINPVNGGVVHARVLDYAVSGPFEKHERTSLYEFKNRLKVFSHGSSGMPFPSLSVMNERGLTLALHYKHGNFLDLKGDSIFSIAYQIASYCSDIHDVKKFLKNYPSMSHWGLYLSDKGGNVASIDVRGREIYQEKFDLKEYGYLYFNNRPLLKDPSFKETQPYGSLQQCKMRRETLERKMKSLGKKKLTDLEALSALAAIGTEKAADKTGDARHWKMDTITPSSVQAVVFDNQAMKTLSVPGPGPKILTDEYIERSDLFGNSQARLKSIKTKTDNNFLRASRYLASFQSHLDAGKVENAYHELQMAVELFEGRPEKQVALFYLYTLEYLYESDNKELSYLREDFVSLAATLPEYLEDQRKLFVMRLEKMLGHSPSHKSSEIKNPNLRRLFEKERKLRPQALKALRKFVFPRIEILDVLYVY